MNNKFFCIFLMLGLMVCANAQNVITVDASGNGDYTTVQAAVDAAPDNAETTIFIKNGTYAENVNIGSKNSSSSKRLSLIGESRDGTVITSSKGMASGLTFDQTPAMSIYASDFYAENITFQNSSGKNGAQALAIYVAGDRQTFNHCAFKGYQDTHRTKKGTRSYYKECLVEGCTDFIYAGGTCWFENCQLNLVGNGYITAPEDVDVRINTKLSGSPVSIFLGFVFNNCTVTRSDAATAGGSYLGRPWGEKNCGSIFLNCNLGDAINKAGWIKMGSNDGTSSYFAEYKSVDGNGSLIDTSNRISWGRQMDEADFAAFMNWHSVDSAFKARTNNTIDYNPEAVIADHATSSINDYTDLEGKLLAFPTARGFGKLASGGRGGKVVEVTNLNDSGEGSLRWALTEAGKEDATIVFRVGGIIKLESDIRAKLTNVTIAGQTAPGDGILYRGAKLNLGGSNNLIIRNIRGRLGKTDDDQFIDGGSIGIENGQNIIIDHCCFGWSGEENMTMYDNHFSTVQWTIVHEGLRAAGHPKGARGYGSQWGGSPATYHHNLLIHNDSRSCRINGSSNDGGDRRVFLEYYNNVNYNWGRWNSCYGGENEASNSIHFCNFIGNYYKPGPATPSGSVFISISEHRDKKTSTGPSRWYFEGNKMEGNATATADNWQGVHNNTKYTISQLKSDELLNQEGYYQSAALVYNYADYQTPTEDADNAYNHVLNKVGTIRRDKVEQRLINELKNGTTTYKGSEGKKGIIDSQFQTEGFFTYDGGTAPADTDHDGMPDEWETANGFNPNDASDGAKVASAEGYTALEIYLNSLMGEWIPINTTGIQQIATIFGNNQPVGWYTLQGIQLAQKPSAPGLYVSNGRKFLVK